MCGIVGGFDVKGIESDSLDAALDAIRHRGPDGVGRYINGPIAIGMRRLAIIDVDGGAQPIFNEDRTVSVVFNGEIYNYSELRKRLEQRGHRFRSDSDTEVLVHLYEEHDTEMCKSLRGMFAFAIWDARKQSLLLARDRFGKKPLFYRRTRSGALLFASELKALRILDTESEWEVSNQGVFDYLSLGYVPQPDTIFQDVGMVPAASWLKFQRGAVTQASYWSLDFPNTPLRYDEAILKTQMLVADAVRARLRSDVPLGVFLSGGVDSSVVAYEAAQVLGSDLRTFTIAMPDASFDESPVADRTAQFLNVRNDVLPLRVEPLETLQRIVRIYDQPFADSSAIPSLAVSELARQHVTVVLNGDGGDEVFAGYHRHAAAQQLQMLRRIPDFWVSSLAKFCQAGKRDRRSLLGFVGRLARGLAMDRGERYLAWTADQLFDRDKQPAWKSGPVMPTERWVESLKPGDMSDLHHQLSADININLASDLLVKMDIATMAHSLEARSPFLDHPLVEFVMSLPSNSLIRRGKCKSLLRDSYRGRLPNEVIDGKKRGFEVPLRRWLDNEFRDIMMDTVGSKSAHVSQFLDHRFVSDVLAGKILRERNSAYIEYSFLVLELWLRDMAQRQSRRSRAA